tara:strand:+ start:467 stop:826 length:360 start_codon:yes stop_codon:yes gene_type:complete
MIIFNIVGEFHGEFSLLPNESYLDESKWVIAEFAEGESYDDRYAYSSVDGVAVKGDLIPVDTTEMERMAAELVATQYSRDRKDKYDKLNQDEMRYDDTKNSTTTWVDAIDAIKAAHPKP